MDGDVSRYHAVITTAFPDLPIRTFRFLAEGWDGAVWEVNGEHAISIAKAY